MRDVVILSAVRTPIGRFLGGLSTVPAPRLGAIAIRGALERAGIRADQVDEVIMGNVLSAGLGQAPARQAALFAGIPAAARCTTVHKVCGSGLQAVIGGTHALAMEEAEVIVAGGMENMSAAPYLLPRAREGYRLGHQQVIDSMIHDGLWDPHHNLHMGHCAEECAKKYGFSREQQDAYASESFRRANAAQKDGRFAREITPVEIAARGSVVKVEHDEGPAKVKYDKIPTLRPAFDQAGTITAANASTINDGAAALVMMRRETAEARGLKPIARIVSFGGHAQDPVWFTTAPVPAAHAALKRAGWSVGDVDVWEINEAFAVVALAFVKELGLSADRVNIRGGAISLGHPIGASGARIMATLIATLRETGKKRGVAAICIGGGEGLAVCVELV